jgi:hypothetical protein
MMQIDRYSFEVVYKKDAQGDEVIDSVVVRAGISDAAVTLTISQVYNLARLLDIIPPPVEQATSDRPSSLTAVEKPRALVIRSDSSANETDADRVASYREDAAGA